MGEREQESRHSPVVRAGSMMTFSPVFKIATLCLVAFCCSASMGDMFDLNAPVPTPITRIAITKAAKAPFESVITEEDCR